MFHHLPSFPPAVLLNWCGEQWLTETHCSKDGVQSLRCDVRCVPPLTFRTLVPPWLLLAAPLECLVLERRACLEPATWGACKCRTHSLSPKSLGGYDPGGCSTCYIGPSRRPSVCHLSLHTPWRLEGLWLGKLNPRYSPAYICVVLSSAHVDKGLHFGESRGKGLGKNCQETFQSKSNLLCLECEIDVRE